MSKPEGHRSRFLNAAPGDLSISYTFFRICESVISQSAHEFQRLALGHGTEILTCRLVSFAACSTVAAAEKDTPPWSGATRGVPDGPAARRAPPFSRPPHFP